MSKVLKRGDPPGEKQQIPGPCSQCQEDTVRRYICSPDTGLGRHSTPPGWTAPSKVPRACPASARRGRAALRSDCPMAKPQKGSPRRDGAPVVVTNQTSKPPGPGPRTGPPSAHQRQRPGDGHQGARLRCRGCTRGPGSHPQLPRPQTRLASLLLMPKVTVAAALAPGEGTNLGMVRGEQPQLEMAGSVP